MKGHAFASLAASVSSVGLTRKFGDKVAVHPMTLHVEPGSITGIIGPNGSGKSTYLRMLVGLVRPDAGEAVLDGVALAGDGTSVRRRCTYSPGEIHVYGEMTGGEHLNWFVRGRAPGTLERCWRIAQELGLPLRARVRTYSHGMKRQLMFAAALGPEVRVRILDEPTEGLDPSKRNQIVQLLTREAEAGVTVLLSSHHLGEVEHACSRLIFFHEGRLVADESPTVLQQRARRIVRLAYGELVDPERVRRVLAGPDVESVTLRAHEVTVALKSEDPREFLRRVAATDELPAPASIGYGKMSLGELYRELYGVEGL